jgi:hypothetical protein
MRRILEEDHRSVPRRAASGEGASAVDALIWALLGGVEGLFLYLLFMLTRDTTKHLPDN